MLILAAALALQGPFSHFNLQQTPACPDAWRATPARAEGPAKLSKLGDLPKAALVLPVLRTVEGCPVSTAVRFEVEGDGRFAPPTRP
jgi:hypothetical protein